MGTGCGVHLERGFGRRIAGDLGKRFLLWSDFFRFLLGSFSSLGDRSIDGGLVGAARGKSKSLVEGLGMGLGIILDWSRVRLGGVGLLLEISRGTKRAWLDRRAEPDGERLGAKLLELNFFIDFSNYLGHGVVAGVAERILVGRLVGDVLHCSKLLLAKFSRSAAGRELGLEETFFVATSILDDDRCVSRSSILGSFLEGGGSGCSTAARRRDNHLVEAVECILGGGRLGGADGSS
jgi:hypothetical protein